ncbi:MAG: radical SAM protein [Candidatus Nanoarchaeia archaeon]|nr:radical SAM protein [Candidatus Haiyanarchaeum thermophilum]MCW1303051.1 radical SAM protein [Candidatus Haiyanarchaeum thermophilum]MCW1304130.1 radical SAM protein [Candidatus Haiyanarchaeum thermophilum]MCW1306839.1 radical SAM protein [Candidatus Haiyanarchaeum thermophilum]MCW1307081.1 radical SAM protein [Candidatus Haiyanarchaeum thermophilum]
MVTKKVWAKEPRPDFCLVRVPSYLGKKYSMVLFGKCNFRCKFCFEKGDKADEKGVLPDARLMDFSELEEFVRREASAGKPIKITGGEPSLYPDETIQLIKIAKSQNVFTQVDVNGSLPDVCEELAKYVDSIGLDIKGNEKNIEYLTGVNKKISLDAPLETLHRAEKFPCFVEFKTVMFDFTDIDHLEWLYSHLPKKAFWELKQYRPHEGVERTPKQIDLRPASKEQILHLMDEMCRRHPDLEDRMVAIIGSAKDYRNYYCPGGKNLLEKFLGVGNIQ